MGFFVGVYRWLGSVVDSFFVHFGMRYSVMVMVLLFLASCQERYHEQRQEAHPTKAVSEWTGSKITGVNLEMPSREIDSSRMLQVQSAGASWVSMIPYAITRSGGAEVEYHHNGHWWGESVEGTKKCIQMARSGGFKVMLKPHVWVIDDGWPGKFDAGTEERWKLWETSYRTYILEFAALAAEEEVELFCIGTEYRIAVVKRPEFWRKLIAEVREIYKGKITYAANWDNYERVTFWSELDYVGIDAYFPLSKSKEPTLKELKAKWNELSEQLGAFSDKVSKSIVFTEYGVRSMDHANAGRWGDYDKVKPNMRNQKVYYQSFFETIWQKDWMGGGFFWKWRLLDIDGRPIGGEKDDDYTPQGKPALHTISDWYCRSSGQ